MRASTSVSPLAASTLFVLAVGAHASSALAVPLPRTCMDGPDCDGGTECIVSLAFPRGVCLPDACRRGDPGMLRSTCFGAGSTLAEAFASGDCDGDLVTNADEDDGSFCSGGAVIGLQAGGEFQWTEPARLDDPMGLAIAPYDATSSVSHAIGIGCTPTRRCPVLPSDPTLRSRCVLVIPDDGELEARGVCTYYTDDRDDDSCLDGIDTSACLSGIDEAPHAQWEHGDCDLDGLQNKADPDVCDRLEIMGRVAGGDVRCVPGAVQGACVSGVGEIASSVYGCGVDEAAEFAPFAYCCRSHEDCPAPMYLGDPSRGRCVFLGSDATTAQVGACTYDEAGLSDDDSCVGAMPALGATCLSTEDVSYTAWANGTCDACDRAPNATDDVVCSACGMADASAQPDAATTPTDDGGADPTPDARVEDGDAGSPSRFAGSGCRCEIASRTAPSPLLALFVCVVLGPPLLGRRKR